jgi:hypothetical protein
MMERFIVNKNAQPTGEHEVHSLDKQCEHLPVLLNYHHLGVFGNCHEAINEAKKTYNNVDGCFYCANECHTR